MKIVENLDYSIKNKNLLKEVKKLLKLGLDPSDQNNWAIIGVVCNGHTEVVKFLLKDPRVDPSAHDNYPIMRAVYEGYTEIVKLLLADPRVDPTMKNNHLIIFAIKNGFNTITDLLKQDIRVQVYSYLNNQEFHDLEVINKLKKSNPELFF